MQPSSLTRATIVSGENQNGATIVKATFFFCHYYIVWESNNAGEARAQSWNWDGHSARPRGSAEPRWPHRSHRHTRFRSTHRFTQLVSKMEGSVLFRSKTRQRGTSGLRRVPDIRSAPQADWSPPQNEGLKSRWIPGGSCGYTSGTKRKHFAALSSPWSCWQWLQLKTSCGSPQCIGSDNGLSPDRRPVIIWTNAGIMLIRILGTNFNEIVSEIQIFFSRKCILKCCLANGGHFVSASMS